MLLYATEAHNVRNIYGMSQVEEPMEIESLPEINQRILQTFKVLGKVSQGIVNGYINASIVSGAAGCGKSFTLERAFEAAEERGEIMYQSVKGAMSAIGLYQQLFQCSGENGVLVVDDCDGIFGDLEALNLLKSALDTGKRRKVCWNKESTTLDAAGVPREFEFNGAVAFVTNIDFVREIERESKMSPHYKALMSRCMYVDLGIHSKREILVRVSQVIYDPIFLKENGLTKTAAAEMMTWLNTNLAKVRILSIRTILHLVSLVKTDNDWKDMANVLMLETRAKPKNW